MAYDKPTSQAVVIIGSKTASRESILAQGGCDRYFQLRETLEKGHSCLAHFPNCARALCALDLSHSVSPSSPTFRACPSITELGGIKVAGRWDLRNLASVRTRPERERR